MIKLNIVTLFSVLILANLHSMDPDRYVGTNCVGLKRPYSSSYGPSTDKQRESSELKNNYKPLIIKDENEKTLTIIFKLKDVDPNHISSSIIGNSLNVIIYNKNGNKLAITLKDNQVDYHITIPDNRPSNPCVVYENTYNFTEPYWCFVNVNTHKLSYKEGDLKVIFERSENKKVEIEIE
ncbi:hypothetical protein M1446_00540 [Candidatus Dependentiae bacterium]|nr:hypothetical protein [Candidatus Dependentiae bacterium]